MSTSQHPIIYLRKEVQFPGCIKKSVLYCIQCPRLTYLYSVFVQVLQIEATVEADFHLGLKLEVPQRRSVKVLRHSVCLKIFRERQLD